MILATLEAKLRCYYFRNQIDILQRRHILDTIFDMINEKNVSCQYIRFFHFF